MIAVRPGAAAVGEEAHDGCDSEDEDDGSADGGEYEPSHDSQRDDRGRAGHELALGQQAECRGAWRPEAVGGVGSGPEVEEVVGEVCGDLEQQRDEDRGGRCDGAEAAFRPARGDPDEDRPN